ncbi:hypothetical protein Ahia01_000839300, partial [Argonauta hians]
EGVKTGDASHTATATATTIVNTDSLDNMKGSIEGTKGAPFKRERVKFGSLLNMVTQKMPSADLDEDSATVDLPSHVEVVPLFSQHRSYSSCSSYFSSVPSKVLYPTMLPDRQSRQRER